MDEFLGREIEVEQAAASPRPVRFVLAGQVHAVAQVLREYVDISHGGVGPRSRKWYNRRHRRHFVVRDSAGAVFDIYLDYANRAHKSWWVLKKLAATPAAR